MPQLGESVTEGTVTKWLKKEGESVALDEALVEVSTDKVDSEIPSTFAGTLTKILVPEGEVVAVGAAMAEITSGDAGGAAAGASTAAPAQAEPSEPPQAPAQAEPSEPPQAPAQAEPSEPPQAPGQAEPSEPAKAPDQSLEATTKSASPAPGASGIMSPLVRKLVAENDVDLSKVSGTGSGGRITREDVMQVLGVANGAAVAEPAALSPKAAPGPPPSRPSGKTGDEVVPLSNMRKLIAQHMVASLQDTARAWNTVEVDMTAVGRLRSLAGGAFKRAHGYSLTWTPFVAKAITLALLEFPGVNSTWNGDGTMTKRHYVNLGIAVALENGLIVPVVAGADNLSLAGLADSIRDLADRARNKKLSPDEIQNGTFTITNPGPFGSIMSVPIINQREAAILAFDAIVKRAVVVTDEAGSDSIAIRQMVFLSLSWDHRLIDGAEAAQFLARLKSILEEADFKSDLSPYLGD